MKLKYTNYEEPISLKDFNDGDERIVFIICPSWSIGFPPFGLSKVVGNARSGGFACKVYDLNIQTYHYLMDKTNKDYWRSENQFYWADRDFYDTHLSNLVNPYITKVVDKIVADNPTIIGLSLYTTSSESSIYLIKKIREKLPDVKIIIGGPHASVSGEHMLFHRMNKDDIDFIFVGESEEIFLDFLKNKSRTEKIIGKIGGRINLDDKSFADYSDYDLSAYKDIGKACLETSRGCIANCVFCIETHFWKFRTINPLKVLDEINHQSNEYGIKDFLITDSSINGDLKNLSKLIDLLILNDLNITWNSYIRCDGRMDRDFIFKISESGCRHLSFGVESGSEKVLSDMKKAIKIWEIEENIKNTFDTNKIKSHVNWLIGFPTEDLIDYYHSNILIYNLRKYINDLSPGCGCGISQECGLATNYQLYGIDWKKFFFDSRFLNNWYTVDFRNTHLNRFMRIKMFHIFLMILESKADSIIHNSQKYDNTGDFFVFNTVNKNTEDYLVQENNIDFNVIKTDNGVNSFSKNIGNEFFPIFYGLFKIFGGFDMKIIFDPEKDFESWGTLSTNYSANVIFNINDSGEYNCTINHELKHYGMTPEIEQTYMLEKIEFGDMSFKDVFILSGNINEWVTNVSLVKKSVHKN